MHLYYHFVADQRCSSVSSVYQPPSHLFWVTTAQPSVTTDFRHASSSHSFSFQEHADIVPIPVDSPVPLFFTCTHAVVTLTHPVSDQPLRLTLSVFGDDVVRRLMD